MKKNTALNILLFLFIVVAVVGFSVDVRAGGGGGEGGGNGDGGIGTQLHFTFDGSNWALVARVIAQGNCTTATESGAFATS